MGFITLQDVGAHSQPLSAPSYTQIMGDQAVLSFSWGQFFQETIVLRAVEGLFYGFECLLAISSWYLLMSIIFKCPGVKPRAHLSYSGPELRTSISRRFLLAATTIMFICSTINFASELKFDIVQIQSLVDPNYDPMPEMIKWETFAIVFSTISYVLGDTIVVWRAWILFDGQYLYRVALLVCILGSFGSGITNVVLIIKRINTRNFTSVIPSQIIFSSALILTNAVATTFISLKTWYYRKFIKSHLGQISQKSRVEHALVLLVESGLIYCGIWILILLAQLNGIFNDLATSILEAIAPHATSMYPTIIILLTALRKSHCDTTLLGDPTHFSFGINESQSIHFNTPMPVSVTTTEGTEHISPGIENVTPFQKES